jgi:hypothetical protein
MSEPLDDLDDEELGRLVRNTAAIRAAIARVRFADDTRESSEQRSSFCLLHPWEGFTGTWIGDFRLIALLKAT